MIGRGLSLLVLSILFFAWSADASYEYKGAQVEGTLSQGLNIGGIQGETTNSLIDSSLNYETNANIRLLHDDLGALNELFETWKLDSEVNIRKTDDAQLNNNQDLDLLYLQIHLYNPYLDFTFGDFSANFSQMTLNRSLEGFQAIVTVPQTNTKASAVLSRAYQAEELTQYTRYVVGGRVEQVLLTEKFELFDRTVVNDLTTGVNVVYNFDAAGSAKADAGVPDISNFVASFNARLKLFDIVTSEIEVARSMNEDNDEITLGGDQWGTAVKIRNSAALRHRYGRSRVNFDYERAMATFFTDSGSASPDREAVYLSGSHRFKKFVSIDGSYREFHNNIQDTGTTSLRIRNPVFKVTIKPFEQKGEYWRDLSTRFQYSAQKSESTNQLIDNQSHTFQGLVSHRVKNISMSGGFKSKRVNDKAGRGSRRTQSLLSRLGYDFISEHFIFNPYIDYTLRYQRDHSPEEDEVGGDLSFGAALSVFERFRMSVNYGYNDVNRSIVGSDTEFHSLDMSASLDITDRLMLIGTYFLTDSNFETHLQDYSEDYGELKIVWTV